MRHAPEIYIAPLLASRQSFERMTEEIGNLYQAMIGTLDLLDGDPDREDDDPTENDDPRETAWIEWERMHPSLRGVRNITGGDHEDAEDDDPKEDDCSDRAVDDDPCDPESDCGI